MDSPLSLDTLFHLGPVGITAPVVVTWAIMAGLGLLSFLSTRRLSLRPMPSLIVFCKFGALRFHKIPLEELSVRFGTS